MKEEYKVNNSKLIEKIKEKKFLITAHRGVWGGNICQNTSYSSKLAKKMGADIVEIDIGRSKDNKYYAFHTSEEKSIFNVDQKFENLESEVIIKHPLLNQQYDNSGYRVEEFKNIVDGSDEDVLYQIDRSQNYFPEFLDYLYDNFDKETLKRLMIKCSINDKNLEIFEKYQYKFMLMPIIRKKDEIKILEKYKNINLIGLEVIAEDKKSDTFGKEFIDEIKEKFGVLVQINSIRISGKFDLYAGLDDDISLIKDPKEGWGKLIQFGADMIQTDWSLALDLYRKIYSSLFS
ncbi:glycerophosphodiester phosphodiesterase family protein [Anaerococcus sp. AGMB09787]|uniref:glycerophosphodiester phosphodiesterase family protein n=1 Tax=Anaerococcus sp. AGMB09787 TaxID=2922869 RepID=UPI001FAF0E0B|nr:glycerophosphodiester phosphodiesterase family protein [Anaerococcus sp. AGMB09787]